MAINDARNGDSGPTTMRLAAPSFRGLVRAVLILAVCGVLLYLTWRTRGVEEGLFLAFHWLDERGNAIIWDGIRTDVPEVASGEAASLEPDVRAPIPPGRYRLASRSFNPARRHRII